MRKAQDDWNKVKQQKFKQNCEIAKDKHLKMFKIEAFLNTVLEKTKTYSICPLVETKKCKDINKDVLQSFSKIFSVPKTETPQIIFYNYSSKAKTADQAKHELVTTRLVLEQSKFSVEVIDCWNEKYFYAP